MVTFSATFRLASLSLAACLLNASCVSRLDDLEAIDQAAGPGADPTSSTPEAPDVGDPIGQDAGPLPSVSVSAEPTASAAPSAPTCTSGQVDSQGFCVPERHCAPGTYIAEADGTFVCTSCPSGTFSTTFDATSCTPKLTCLPGEYVADDGTTKADRTCEPCPSGMTSTTENAGECSSASDCQPGTYKDGSDCTQCSAGSYCSGKSDHEEACVTDTWDNDLDPATPCIAVTSCISGEYLETEATTTTDRVCAFCESGSFSSGMNAASCTAWSDCDAGSYVSAQGTPETDRVCEACPDGSYSAASNAASCSPWMTCQAPNRYASSSPSPVTDRVCADCALGDTSAADNAANCAQDPTANIVRNATFEATAAPWFSWVGTVSVSTAKAHSGSQSLLVSGTGTGPAAISLDAAAVAGATYAVSFWVSVGKVATAPVNTTRALTCGGTTTYTWIANHGSVSSSAWTQLSGSFTIDAGCASPKLMIYAEGGNANVDLYVDDVVVTKSK